MPRIKEFPIAQLGIPALVTQRSKRSDGSYRCYVRAKLDGVKYTTVGQVHNDQEYGPISFYISFAESYPQVKKVTVIRTMDHSYVYREDTKHQPPLLGPRRWYHQDVIAANGWQPERKPKAQKAKAQKAKPAPARPQATNARPQASSARPSYSREQVDVLQNFKAQMGYELNPLQLQEALHRVELEEIAKITQSYLQHQCPTKPNTLLLMVFNIADFSDCDYALEQDGTKLHQLLLVCDCEHEIPIYFDLVNCAPHDIKALIAQAQKFCQRLRADGALSDFELANAKPLILYNEQEQSDLEQVVASARAAGFDLMVAVHPFSPLGDKVMQSALENGLLEGENTLTVDDILKIMPLPLAQCPTYATAQGPQRLHLNIAYHQEYIDEQTPKFRAELFGAQSVNPKFKRHFANLFRHANLNQAQNEQLLNDFSHFTAIKICGHIVGTTVQDFSAPQTVKYFENSLKLRFLLINSSNNPMLTLLGSNNPETLGGSLFMWFQIEFLQQIATLKLKQFGLDSLDDFDQFSRAHPAEAQAMIDNFDNPSAYQAQRRAKRKA